ncbi:serine/threonine-protein phosphatase 6 regulatory ankyrin repeat subunit B-like [Platysternon megacephalum]|uniref:Serine/threonine-protein phosphatase 6 regulatory ankyrin repeat subunit B-like n=1 Tax=Platysternon megacephalum TaxID=55544 RepID=A0A4D9E383_9SAUR|nr:serine/threonine-protein phosphatase 6 regulatory ankyrin repeat subunit B-like [Platysternon megacephalum]
MDTWGRSSEGGLSYAGERERQTHVWKGLGPRGDGEGQQPTPQPQGKVMTPQATLAVPCEHCGSPRERRTRVWGEDKVKSTAQLHWSGPWRTGRHRVPAQMTISIQQFSTPPTPTQYPHLWEWEDEPPARSPVRRGKPQDGVI